MQRTLMKASGQTLPDSPRLHKGVVLYAALNLEEGAETIDGLKKAMRRVVDLVPVDSRDQNLLAMDNLVTQLEVIGVAMKASSKSIRAQLAVVSNDYSAELTEAEVIEMADGTTDLTVTNSGFALSLGIDGAACYNEVAGSNLSKRNDEGAIDKTPDGKWIKNPKNYREPNLKSVIYPAAPKKACCGKCSGCGSH